MVIEMLAIGDQIRASIEQLKILENVGWPVRAMAEFQRIRSRK
jgi:hypothetical protein